MAVSNSHITILTLIVNGLNAPIKRHRLASWIKSQEPSMCCIQETHLMCKDKHRLKIKEIGSECCLLEKIYNALFYTVLEYIHQLGILSHVKYGNYNFSRNDKI